MDWKSHRIEATLEHALIEDRAVHDSTTNVTIDPNLRASASIIARQEMIVAGLGAIPQFLEIFARLDPLPEAHTRYEVVSHPEIFDGVRVRNGQVLAVIRHNARVLLSCERVILNLLQHLSGIATLTREYVDAIQGTKAHILDTRKTMPGLRALEKYAVLCGGGTNHRLDLASGILIKNNHISLGGGLRTALTNALARRKPGNRVQAEVRNQAELEEALDCGAEAILLDNMTPAQVKHAVERIRKEERWIPVEASGGIVLENIRSYAEAGVDFISVGALTHSAKAADISMRIVAEPSKMHDLAALEAAFAQSIYSGKFHHTAVTGSTNTDAVAAAREGAPHGSVFFTEEQTAGRGRGEHGWQSAAGQGLYVSVLLRPKIALEHMPLIPLAAGLAAAQAIGITAGLQVDLRWPNDLLIGERKTGGILVESKTESGAPGFAVVGIGINVHQRSFDPDLSTPATSLDIEAGRRISRHALLISLLESLQHETWALLDPGLVAAIPARVAFTSTWVSGRRVEVHGPQSCVGVTAGLDEHGFLLVRTDGGVVTVQTGGIRAAE